MNRPANFNEHPQRTEHLAIAMAHKNEALIADQVLPRIRTAGKFDYSKYDLSQGFRLPDTKVGKFSNIPKLTTKSETIPSSLEYHAISEDVSKQDVDDAPDSIDPLGEATERVTDLVKLAREVRVANLVFSSSTYGTNNKDTLSGSDQFSHADSTPLKLILDRIASMVRPANIGVIGLKEAIALKTNPSVVKAVNGNSGDSGVADLQVVARLLGLQKILVGEPLVDLALKGEEPNLTRVWSGNMALLYINPLASNRGGLTFGFTAWDGQMDVRTEYDGKRGQGVYQQIVGERVRELVAAAECGFLLEDIIATEA